MKHHPRYHEPPKHAAPRTDLLAALGMGLLILIILGIGSVIDKWLGVFQGAIQ